MIRKSGQIDLGPGEILPVLHEVQVLRDIGDRLDHARIDHQIDSIAHGIVQGVAADLEIECRIALALDELGNMHEVEDGVVLIMDRELASPELSGQAALRCQLVKRGMQCGDTEAKQSVIRRENADDRGVQGPAVEVIVAAAILASLDPYVVARDQGEPSIDIPLLFAHTANLLAHDRVGKGGGEDHVLDIVPGLPVVGCIVEGREGVS